MKPKIAICHKLSKREGCRKKILLSCDSPFILQVAENKTFRLCLLHSIRRRSRKSFNVVQINPTVQRYVLI